MSENQIGSETVAVLGKSSPPAAVSAATLAGVSLETWVLIATLVYTVVSLAWLLYKVVRHFAGRTNGTMGAGDE